MSKLKPTVGHSDHHLGNPQASIVLVEYGDYECPHCGLAHPFIQRLVKEMDNKIHFVFRNFPLAKIHPHAMSAALAAEAASRQGKFWPMHDMILENQGRLGEKLFVQLAEKLGLDVKAFQNDCHNESIEFKVERDFESGIRSEINGTPTFFVNGMPVNSYDETYESLEEAVHILT